MNTVRQFSYFEVSISKFEKTHAKVLQEWPTHVFTEFDDSQESPKGAFLH